ncbi:wound-responsive family protein [Actinidia rufa]|uniref:Wound-responsive family protein n=1 Tax=Actinidia rufa TaxID=165716 RepID=A0A7J0G6T6_9ERIC|nr:wound-responsive family protein [Actinidia rufa]
MSRVNLRVDTQAMERIKEKSPKGDSIQSVNDSVSNAGACNTAAKARNDNQKKHTESSIRTVMYLSCWGPN